MTSLLVGWRHLSLRADSGVVRRTATLYVDILERQGWGRATSNIPDHRRMVLRPLLLKGLHLLAELGDVYKRRLAQLLTDMPAIQAERLRHICRALTRMKPSGWQINSRRDGLLRSM